MASGRHNFKVITTGAGHYDEDYVRKKLEKANKKVAAAMARVQMAHNQVSYVGDSSSSTDSSDDDGGQTYHSRASNRKPQGSASVQITKQLGSGNTANINIHSAKNVQLGDRNVMVINKGVKKPPKEEKMEVNEPPIPDATPVELTVQQQAVLDSELVVDEANLKIVARHIGKPWRRIFRKLGLSEEEIDQLHIDFDKDGIFTVIFNGLLKWQQTNGREAKLGKLVKVVYDITKNIELINHMIKSL